MKHYESKSFATLFIILLISTVKTWDFPNPKFVANIADYFNRNGLIYYLPEAKKSKIQQYFKESKK